MSALEVVLGLLVVVAALATAARRLGVPPPILMLLGGIALGFVPGLTPIALDPNIVFLLFLPPPLSPPQPSRDSSPRRWDGRKPSRSARSWPHPTRSPRRRSCSASASHGA